MFAKRSPAIAIVLAVALVLTVASTASAQSYLIQRMDWEGGGKMNPVTAVVTPAVELWAYGYANGNLTDLEIGISRPIDKKGQFLVGAYAATWPEYGYHFFLPWFTFKGPVGSGELLIDVGYYVPLNGGPRVFNGNDIAYLWPVNKPEKKVPLVEVGLSASFLQVDGESAPISFGPKVRIAKGLELSWQPLTFGGGEASHKFRLQCVCPF